MEITIERPAKQLGYELKAKQKPEITSFDRGEDVFAVLPTESLCCEFLLPVFDNMRENGLQSVIIIIVTPSITIMKDQN